MRTFILFVSFLISCSKDDKVDYSKDPSMIFSIIQYYDTPIGCRILYSNTLLSGYIYYDGDNFDNVVSEITGGEVDLNYSYLTINLPNEFTIVFTEHIKNMDTSHCISSFCLHAVTKTFTYVYANRRDMILEDSKVPYAYSILQNPRTGPKYLTFNATISGGPMDGTDYTFYQNGSLTGNYKGIDISTMPFSDERSEGYFYEFYDSNNTLSYQKSHVYLNGSEYEGKMAYPIFSYSNPKPTNLQTIKICENGVSFE